jgi:hypothetical protein
MESSFLVEFADRSALDSGRRVGNLPMDIGPNALTDFTDLEVEALGPVPLLLLGIGAIAFFIRRRRRPRHTI